MHELGIILNWLKAIMAKSDGVKAKGGGDKDGRIGTFM